MGLVYAGLARAAKGPGEDTRRAREWLEKSLAAWRELQNHPSFAPPHRNEMRQVGAALAALP